MSTDAPQVLNNASVAILPFELVQSLNQTYFLHLLLTDPTKVIPPGKSLLSMMQHANFKVPGEVKEPVSSEEILHRVKNVAHRAFWDEVLEVLSSPSPPLQMPRLQRLYADIYDSLSPLFPPTHPVIVTLSSPVPPTTSPLHSTLHFLREIVDALLLRCAPVRDSALQAIRPSLSDPPFSYPMPHSDTLTPLAEFVVDKIKSIIDIAELMKSDLNSFILGTMSEAQLKGVLFRVAKEQERDLVVKLWGGKDAVREQWRSWLKDLKIMRETAIDKWISRLVMAVTSDHPVYCAIPQQQPLHSNEETNEIAPNRLPPQMFYFEHTLRFVQDYIQATVIMAVLRNILPRLSKPSEATSATDTQERGNFMRRVWSLLMDEIETQTTHNEPGSTAPLKLVNIADEVVRAYEAIARIPSEGNPDPKVSDQLRFTVENVLRSNDAVYMVLKRRLTNALEKGLLAERDHEVKTSSSEVNTLSSVNDTGRRGPSNPLNIPIQVQTGQIPAGIRGFDMNATKKIKLDTGSSEGYPFSEFSGGSLTAPQGFEDALLQDCVLNLFKKLTIVVEWTESVWGDLV
ncbi:hypothetical protein BJ165DRAFT_1453934 [Panaeolus papilionaceus]|nr:hypothetical protein BJ165DRAFT_1453934 [Panaeolus papilionaceus]